MKHIAIVTITLFFLMIPVSGQQLLPLEIKLSGGYQQPTGLKRVESASGFTLGGQLTYTATENLNLHFDIGYDYTYLTQGDVLDEWDWGYWEETYIPFLPAVDVEEVNRTLRYDDGERSAVFEPEQSLKELRLAIGSGYQFQLADKITGFMQFDFGASRYSRELRMTEHWTRRFESTASNPEGSVDTSVYNYSYDLLHFAPAKTGWRLFIAPALGASYKISDCIDLIAETKYLYYLQRNQVQWLEELLSIPAESEKFFPVKAKWLIAVGVRFNY
jgi:hypothetical protein